MKEEPNNPFISFAIVRHLGMSKEKFRIVRAIRDGLPSSSPDVTWQMGQASRPGSPDVPML